ncbi:hypothetical protein ACHAAC_11050 [Aeromicrobium sp. CF4.19]|uniref:DUF7064 domain-containing protein n=1 Tax=Aeromicrobium sp. CF4.19 TaxID=3373082 RepID=UPI003EE5F4FF
MSTSFKPNDDYLHPITDHPDHNESAYYSFAVHDGLTGWVRIGNRVNDGFAEVTICLYLPDGSIGFWWDRADIRDPLLHDAGGLTFEVIEPFQHHRVTYRGPVAIFTDYRVLENPRAAFSEAERRDVAIDLTFHRASPVWSGGPDVKILDNFAGAHFEQHMSTAGTATVGEEVFSLDNGLSLRDHSWGPRRWQQISWYRWLTASFASDLGIACTMIGTDTEGEYIAHGYIHHGPESPATQIVGAKATTSYVDGWYPASVEWVISTEDGATHEVSAEVRTPLPLRHRRDGQTTRIIEGPTTYTWEGRRGVGMTEYLDLMVDGSPIGRDFA